MPQQLPPMSGRLEQLSWKIDHAVADGQLMESTANNIRTLLEGAPSDLYLRAVDELVNALEWSELNDRFYWTLAFGTGGIRGRTIGKIVTLAERGKALPNERPEFPCVARLIFKKFIAFVPTHGNSGRSPSRAFPRSALVTILPMVRPRRPPVPKASVL